MALKTQPNDASVTDYLATIEDDTRRADCEAICALMQRVTGAEPVMWGDRIVGFGTYDYTYASGQAGTWFLCGFAPRKRDLTLYIMDGFGAYDDLMQQLGKHKTGKSCLYIRRLSDIDVETLEALIRDSVQAMRERYDA